MARLPRVFLPGYPQHVIQRGNNRAAVFLTDGDREFYLDCLREACERYGCDVHAYVLMTNHVHLLVTPSTADALPRAMQRLGMRFALYVNWRRERTGTLWEGRYRATTVDSDSYFLTCSRYIELNPVRAYLASHPREHSWSSYGANVTGTLDRLVKPHAVYLALGDSEGERRKAYASLFDVEIGPEVLAEIRDATNNGWPLGSPVFRARIEDLSQRRAEPKPRGGCRSGAGRPVINRL